jgi:hypothetical protein
MPQQQNFSSGQAGQHPVHFTALALRSAGQLYDINLSVTRTLLRTQARTAAAFGLPDWSPLLDSADDRARQLFSTGAEQILNTAQRANEAARELQRQMGRVLETQTARAAETWQRGLQELGTQTSQGLTQLCDAARETAEETQRAVEEMAQQSQQAMQQASRAQQQAGQTVQQATQQAAQQAGDGAAQAASDAGTATGHTAHPGPKENELRKPKQAS